MTKLRTAKTMLSRIKAQALDKRASRAYSVSSDRTAPTVATAMGPRSSHVDSVSNGGAQDHSARLLPWRCGRLSDRQTGARGDSRAGPYARHARPQHARDRRPRGAGHRAGRSARPARGPEPD